MCKRPWVVVQFDLGCPENEGTKTANCTTTPAFLPEAGPLAPPRRRGVTHVVLALPDLNPWDEGGWHHLKNVEMRNLVCRDLEELHQEFYLAVARLRQKPHLLQSFFAQAGLKLVKT